jgi:hypothetical protein
MLQVLSQAGQSNQAQQSRQSTKSGSCTMGNPGLKDARKWIVCEGVIARKNAKEVRSVLESAYRSSGQRIKEYIAHLRQENNLDFRIESGIVVCRKLRRNQLADRRRSRI